jgi:hypothetical protein
VERLTRGDEESVELAAENSDKHQIVEDAQKG